MELGENRIKYHIIGRTDGLLMHCISAHQVNSSTTATLLATQHQDFESTKITASQYREVLFEYRGNTKR
jgi:hypothetical protein